MGEYKLKPWSLRPLQTALLTALLLFVFGAPAVMTLRRVFQGQSDSAGLLLTSFVIVCALGSGWCFWMYNQAWRDVAWSINFWTFISGPAPEYPQALQAWHWGRRFRTFLFLGGVFAAALLVRALAAR